MSVIRMVRCWLCGRASPPLVVFPTPVGYECADCTRALDTPLTPAERADYEAFKARADAQRAAKCAAVSLPGDER